MQWVFCFLKHYFGCLWVVLDHVAFLHLLLFFPSGQLSGRKDCLPFVHNFEHYLSDIGTSKKITSSFSALTSHYDPWTPPDPVLWCRLQLGSKRRIPPVCVTSPSPGKQTSLSLLCANNNKIAISNEQMWWGILGSSLPASLPGHHVRERSVDPQS